MINLEVLTNDLLVYVQGFYKILEVNVNEGTFCEVKLEEQERTAETNIQQWIVNFMENNIYIDDWAKVIDFLNANKLREAFRNHWMQRIFYRRRVDNKWRYVCMEMVPLQNYDEDDPIVLLAVRDVEDYIDDFRTQHAFDCVSHWQIDPKQPVVVKYDENHSPQWSCPHCGKRFFNKMNYCYDCGQALDWSKI